MKEEDYYCCAAGDLDCNARTHLKCAARTYPKQSSEILFILILSLSLLIPVELFFLSIGWHFWPSFLIQQRVVHIAANLLHNVYAEIGWI
jgi:hypothetical protein